MDKEIKVGEREREGGREGGRERGRERERGGTLKIIQTYFGFT